MKKLITIAILIFTIAMTTKQQECFFWGITILHTIMSWWLTKGIKNKALKSATFIILMGTIIISINVMKPLTTSIMEQLNASFFDKTFEIFKKSNTAIAELAYRIYKNEWRQFNPSETLRRAVFGATITLSFLSLSWEGMKKIPLTKK